MSGLLGLLYTLPDSLFAGAVPLGDVPAATSASEERSADSDPASSTPLEDELSRARLDGGMTCLTCGIGVRVPGFASASEQRDHFHTDWHRHNARRKAVGRLPLAEDEFERLAANDGELSSISGSESGSDNEPGAAAAAQRRRGSGGVRVCFTARDGRHFAVWRALLAPDAAAAPGVPAAALADLRATAGPWAAGGSGGPGGAGAPLEVLAHKTFHRYVVRAKQGGRQAGKDATGKFAKSAGSQLRRYNEVMLERDIQATLRSWQAHLAAASLIFVQAPGMNAAAIFGGNAPPLSRADLRLRTVPFPTRRPTFAEAKRVVRTLLTVYTAAPPAPAPPPPPHAEARAKQPRATGGKAGAEPDQSHAAAQPEPPPPEPEEPPLHRAARTGDATKVAQLLEAGADPALPDSRGRTAYALAPAGAEGREARDAFRRRRAAAGEAATDWAAAGVPEALTPEMEAAQAARQAEKKTRLKEREKERRARAVERKAAADAEAAERATAEVAAAAAAAAEQAGRQRVRAAAPAAAAARAAEEARLNREQLAAAAEARMARLQRVAQQQQLW
ncbi:hypothetical protein WJX81_003953 [Elliptochloris bilobata]